MLITAAIVLNGLGKRLIKRHGSVSVERGGEGLSEFFTPGDLGCLTRLPWFRIVFQTASPLENSRLGLVFVCERR